MKLFLPSNTLVPMNDPKRKLLTLELDIDTLAEFSAAAEVFGARSKSTFLNQYVVQKIREARQTVSKEEFEALVKKQKKQILQRSEQKSLERRASIDKSAPITEEKIIVSDSKKQTIPIMREAAGSGDRKTKK